MEGPLFEVELKLRVNAKTADDKPVFLLELVYAGLFQIVNVPDEVLQQILLIEGPHLLFPFARRIISDAVRDGGMPPLMIEPIDFAALYRAKQAQMQQMRGGVQEVRNRLRLCSRAHPSPSSSATKRHAPRLPPA